MSRRQQIVMSDAGRIGVVTAHDISSALDKLDAAAAGLNAAVISNPSAIPPAMLAQWNIWFSGYQKFSADNHDLFPLTLGLANIGDEVVGYQNELQDWQSKLKQYIEVYQPMPRTTAEGSGLSDVELGIAIGVGAVAVGWAYFRFLAPRGRR